MCRGASANLRRDCHRALCPLAEDPIADLGQIEARRGDPLRDLAPRHLRALPGRWPHRARLQHRRASNQAPGHHEKELTLRRQRRRRKELGNHREAAAGGEDEQR